MLLSRSRFPDEDVPLGDDVRVMVRIQHTIEGLRQRHAECVVVGMAKITCRFVGIAGRCAVLVATGTLSCRMATV